MKKVFVLVLISIFFLSVLSSLMGGVVNIPLKVVLEVFTGKVTGIERTIVIDVRVPRIILATLVGIALSLTGAILQSLFLNPLAEPYITGVSSGAAFGATLAFFFYLPAFPYLPLFSFLGSFLTLIMVYLMAKRNGKVNSYVLLLAGVALSAFFGALVSVLMVKSGRDLHALVFWLLGSFSGRGWSEVKLAIPLIPLLFIPMRYFRELNLFLQGEERAFELGVETEKVKKLLFFLSSLLTAIAVSVSGIIGFVGLIVPHISRLLFGPDHRRVLLASLLLGPSLMLSSDLLARVVFSPSEMPVGVVTSFFGAPFFIYLLIRRKN